MSGLPSSLAGSDLGAFLAQHRELHAEAEAVVAHFRERPVITAEDASEDDARWIMRYDRVLAQLKELGYV